MRTGGAGYRRTVTVSNTTTSGGAGPGANHRAVAAGAGRGEDDTIAAAIEVDQASCWVSAKSNRRRKSGKEGRTIRRRGAELIFRSPTTNASSETSKLPVRSRAVLHCPLSTDRFHPEIAKNRFGRVATAGTRPKRRDREAGHMTFRLRSGPPCWGWLSFPWPHRFGQPEA